MGIMKGLVNGSFRTRKVWEFPETGVHVYSRMVIFVRENPDLEIGDDWGYHGYPHFRKHPYFVIFFVTPRTCDLKWALDGKMIRKFDAQVLIRG